MYKHLNNTSGLFILISNFCFLLSDGEQDVLGESNSVPGESEDRAKKHLGKIQTTSEMLYLNQSEDDLLSNEGVKTSSHV